MTQLIPNMPTFLKIGPWIGFTLANQHVFQPVSGESAEFMDASSTEDIAQ